MFSCEFVFGITNARLLLIWLSTGLLSHVTELLLLFLDASKPQNPSRKQSVSRSLKHLFNSSNKFVKTLKRFVMIEGVFYTERCVALCQNKSQRQRF